MKAFTQVPYKIYRQTFLQNVLVCIRFSKELAFFDSEIFRTKFKAYIEEVFNINPSVDFATDGYGLESGDKLISFIFNKEYSAVKVGVRNYRSFEESVMPQVHRLKRFVNDVLQIEKPDELSIRKINIFPLKVEENTLNIDAIMEDIFSEELLNSKNSEKDKFESSINITKKIVFTEGEKTAIVRTLSKQSENNTVSIILDTELILKNKLDLSESAEKLIEINRELFDLFHWCVTPNVIKMME